MLAQTGRTSKSNANSDAKEPKAETPSLIKMEELLNEEDSNVAEVVLSNKGGPKVIHKGFMYTLHKKQPNTIRWRCVGRTLHCRGSLITTGDCKKPRIRMQHNHSPDFAAAQLARKRYIALGQPPVLSDDEPRPQMVQAGNLKPSDFVTWADWQVQNPLQFPCPMLPILPNDEETKRITRSTSRNNSEIGLVSDWQSSDQSEGQFLPGLQKGDLQGPGGGLNGRLPMNTMHPTAAASSFPNYKSSPVSHKFPGSVKQRKVNFSTREVETLLAMVRQYRDAILMSVANGRGWLQAWQSVAKAVSAADGVERSESDCRKKWTYLKWEARHTSKPGRTPTSRAVLDILLNKDSTLENHFAPSRGIIGAGSGTVGNKILTADPSNTRGNEQLMIPRDWEGLLQSHLRPLLPTPTQASSGSKTIRIGQSLIRPRPIAPAPSQHLQQSQQQQQHHPQQQQQQSPQQQQQLQLPLQQQQQPKTLVLKTIPLKVKHVAPTTIKMAPRQPPTVIPQTTVPQQPTEVCLRWNSYHSNMQNSFPSLLDTEQFVDVTLACEGRSLKCHKMILSTCSDYLADLLRENPCQHPIILMKDIKFWEVEALVRFMYRGEVNVAHDKLPQLLNAAEALQVKGLAGPSPSSQSTKPPMLIPQSKPSTSQPIIQRISAETKEARSQPPNTVNVITAPKRTQKRRPSESNEPSKPFTKIRLQRPQSPVSPTVTVKLEPLDIPLSPTEMFPDGHDDNRSSSPARYGNLDDFHEEEDPEGDRERSSRDRDLNFCEIPGPPDLNDSEEQMEFVPTDFLEQEQDILDDHENEHEHDPDQDGEDGEDGEDEDDGDDGDEIHELNDKDESPGRSRDHDDEIEDDDYSEKLPGDNNMT